MARPVAAFQMSSDARVSGLARCPNETRCFPFAPPSPCRSSGRQHNHRPSFVEGMLAVVGLADLALLDRSRRSFHARQCCVIDRTTPLLLLQQNVSVLRIRVTIYPLLASCSSLVALGARRRSRSRSPPPAASHPTPSSARSRASSRPRPCRAAMTRRAVWRSATRRRASARRSRRSA